MIQMENGEIEIKKDSKSKVMYVLAFLLALGVFLVMQRLGAVTKFVDGSQVVYEGVVSDSAAAGITVIDSPFYRKVDPREYVGLSLANGDGLCIYTASQKAPDHKKYLFPIGIRPGDLIRITAAEEVGTGLMVVLDAKVMIPRDDFLDYVSKELRLNELPAANCYTSSEDQAVTAIMYDNIGADILYTLLQDEASRSYLWRPLPLSENLSEALYGNTSRLSTEASLLLPEIKNGWWFLKASDDSSYDDQEDYSMVSCNFTAAIYDADTDTLYYIEIDT